MARKVNRTLDPARTELLGLDELYVEKFGSASDFYAYNAESAPSCCPFCGWTNLRNQGRFTKDYLDCITDESGFRLITLHYDHYKYKCLNEACKRVFPLPTRFADRDSHVTRRLEDEIAQRVIQGYSYQEISAQLKETLTRQAVGQIFNRWVHRREEASGSRYTPSVLGIVTGHTCNDSYTLVLNLDEGIRILDVLLGVSFDELSALLRGLNRDRLRTIVTDFNPTVLEAVQDQLPTVQHIIPAEFWFRLVTEDFLTFSHDSLRWSTVKNKEQILLEPPGSLGLLQSNLNKLMDTRPALRKPYTDYNRLRGRIFDRSERWIFSELTGWTQTVGIDFRSSIDITVQRLYSYQSQLEACSANPELIPIGLDLQTSRLEEYIYYKNPDKPQEKDENGESNLFSTFSDELLKARVLYCIPENEQTTQGVPIEAVTYALSHMNTGGKQHEYQ